MNFLSRLFFGVPTSRIPSLLPGTAAAVLLAWISIRAAAFLGETVLGFDQSPVSAVMTAVLLGMVIGNTGIPLTALAPGLSFAVKKLLRLGIMLLGFRLSIIQALRLGLTGLPVVIVCIAAALWATHWIAGRMHIPRRLGTLIAAGTSICGVSAIVAAAPVIGAEDEEISYAVAVITVFGILATLIYPYAAQFLFSGETAVGVFLGTAVHDTSQVTGAAMVHQQVFQSETVLQTAAVVKLVRNLFMIAVIPLLSVLHAAKTPRTGQTVSPASMVPLFILGFIGFTLARTAGDALIAPAGAELWQTLQGSASVISSWCITAALAGVGMTTRFRSFARLGVSPFLAGLAAAAVVGLVSFGMISLLL